MRVEETMFGNCLVLYLDWNMKFEYGRLIVSQLSYEIQEGLWEMPIFKDKLPDKIC